MEMMLFRLKGRQPMLSFSEHRNRPEAEIQNGYQTGGASVVRFWPVAALAKGRSGLIVDDVDGQRHLARRGAISRLAGPKRLVQLCTLLTGRLPLLIQVLR